MKIAGIIDKTGSILYIKAWGIRYMEGSVVRMSEKELAYNLLENVPEYKLGYVIAYLQGITADEAADDAFCEKLCREYEADPDKGDMISIEEMAKISGVDLNAI